MTHIGYARPFARSANVICVLSILASATVLARVLGVARTRPACLRWIWKGFLQLRNTIIAELQPKCMTVVQSVSAANSETDSNPPMAIFSRRSAH